MTLLRRAGRSVLAGPAEMDALLAAAAAGSERDLAALAETGRWLGIGLAGLVNVLNPGLVVFGGLFQRIHPYVAAAVEGEVDRRTLPGPRRLVRVVAGKLGSEAPLIGAAELALEPVLADPARWLRGPGSVFGTATFADRRVVA